MEAVRTSETSVDNHFTRQYNPEDSSEHLWYMMEAVRTSETSVDNHFTRQYNPEDSSEHHTRRRENLKSHIPKVIVATRQDIFFCGCLFWPSSKNDVYFFSINHDLSRNP
jgi:thiamine phosphate synthase YjbQ (UPF0047 family)